MAEKLKALAVAKSEADAANTSKTQFLAAASHDILQPLNAARLFTSTLVERMKRSKDGELVRNVDSSLEAVEEILSALQDQGYSQDDIFAVHLALEEAFQNAVRHGNRMNPAKKVTIDYAVDPEQVEVRMTDEGAGFGGGVQVVHAVNRSGSAGRSGGDEIALQVQRLHE